VRPTTHAGLSRGGTVRLQGRSKRQSFAHVTIYGESCQDREQANWRDFTEQIRHSKNCLRAGMLAQAGGGSVGEAGMSIPLFTGER